ncbi:hypothetical protein [Branchiibius cervicis]|uniref:Uncharacterized protein n=1 Tax=Branchiibius cervicis TaxID=908252 RepID=A0ABW2AQF6_9MICO
MTKSGWGNADKGGAWTLSGVNTQFATNGSVGAMTATGPGNGSASYLPGVSAKDINYSLEVTVPRQSSGSGYYATLIGRHTTSGDYRLKLIFGSAGTIRLQVSKLVANSETALQTVAVNGVNYTGGSALRARFVLNGATLSGSVWSTSGAEPRSPQLSTTDNTPALQSPGSVGLQSYVSSAANSGAVTFTYNDLLVQPA